MSLHDAYTAPGSRCVRHFGRKWSCENAFLRGSRPCCSGLAASQLDHTHAAAIHSPREPMDRVRRCCTGEMFQPTRLKGQLTPSCLAPLASKLPLHLRPPRPIGPMCLCCFVFIPSLYRLLTTACRCPRSASYSRCARSSFPPHFADDSSCIPLPRTYNG